MMPSGNSHKKDYAFVIEKKSDHEEIYQVSIDDALTIAKTSDNLVFIECCEKHLLKIQLME